MRQTIIQEKVTLELLIEHHLQKNLDKPTRAAEIISRPTVRYLESI
jgi:hypothetical protein